MPATDKHSTEEVRSTLSQDQPRSMDDLLGALQAKGSQLRNFDVRSAVWTLIDQGEVELDGERKLRLVNGYQP